MYSLKLLFSIFTPKQCRLCVILFVAMLIGGVLEAAGIGTILPLISVMGQPDFLDHYPQAASFAQAVGIHTHTSLIMSLAALLIVLYFVKNIYIAWETRLQINFAMYNQMFYASQLMRGYLAKPYTFFLENNTATLLRNVSQGPITVFTAAIIPAFMILTEMVTATVIWLMLVMADPFTAIVVAGVMGAMLLSIIRVFRRSIMRMGHASSDAQAGYLKWLNQGLGAIKETKVLCRENFFAAQFEQAYRIYGDAYRKFTFVGQVPRLLIESIVVTALLLLIMIKLALGQQPMEIVPLLGVLALAAFRLMPSANRIVTCYNNLKFQMPLIQELYPELMEIRREQMEGKQRLPLDQSTALPFSKSIRVENLCFAYEKSVDLVLRDVNFEIRKGCFMGVVGPSGAGKTTFVDLLLGLLKPTGGRILVDGYDIADNVRGWRANIAYVPQSIYLIDATIRENIALGETTENIDDHRIEEALRKAELSDFVNMQPDGVRTVVGERGVKLSGGQRQRIGIARAIYQHPTVLVLDEATSALDGETERSITDTILKLKGQITIISIAHRVSTLEECDFKVHFDNGTASIEE